WRRIGCCDNIPPRTINFICQSQSDRLAGYCFVKVSIHGDYALDSGCFATRQNTDFITWFNGSAGNLAAETSKIQIGAIDPLHRHSKWVSLIGGIHDLDIFEMLDEI